ncbi:MAG: hypothetical protein FWC16_10950 [Defluviitaleaceae bacterium]|nr:hypothetical protein [Defluviitaleaceae bacterium]MCL2275436.1 hypothetical protein [Defluviitaleaceae bacterium]
MNMKRFFITLVTLALLAGAAGIFLWTNTPQAHAEAPYQPTSIIRTPAPKFNLNGTFETNLLHAMPTDVNYMISPFSLRMALAMAANGAEGETLAQILTVLDIACLTQFNADIRAFIESAITNELVEINVANSIWLNHDFFDCHTIDFDLPFYETISHYFHGTAQRVNNSNGADKINAWVQAQTHGRIRDIIDETAVEENLAFLVNAIHFLGDWAHAFNLENTQPRIFTDRLGEEIYTDMMEKTRHFSFYANEYFQMMAKPYTDPHIRMYLVLPTGDELPLFSDLQAAIPRMSYELIRLRLPRFTTRSLFTNLVEILQAMGITCAFHYTTAEFIPMFTDLPTDYYAYINNILQKTFIEVNEEGTEAAAVTAVVMVAAPVSACVSPLPRPFFCDRPFLYFIRNDVTGDILFMGEFAFVE